MECMEDKMGYETNLVSFVLPICFNINKDASAMAYTFVTIFFAQYTNTHLQVSDYFTIGIFALAFSIATPGIPNAILIMLIVMLEPLGIPTTYVTNIIAVDIIVDRFGTVANVLGSGICAAVVDNYSKKKRALLAQRTEDNIEENA
ncbi:hypothetical protein L9F63_003849 [Diploptera punctata]|uniref:Amino acid transporter n=1 Tax=Diploptera punctata TaxID=6984 RepID=A0AAD7ZJE0_DIPPU|nr:hypothetical protein L9F63_003849 [Diploptera punctata]